jgi:ferric-dicitrate binding protein FerR (iron transport regulator)
MRARRRTGLVGVAALAVGLGAAVGAAWGAEQRGTVKRVDQARQRVELEDGTELWLMPGASLDVLPRGRRVKIVYDERDGKKWVRSVEAIN